MTSTDTDDRPLDLEQRKSLLWFREHSPSPAAARDLPQRPHRIVLLQRGLIEFDPARKRFDPVTYVITQKGRDYLRGLT